MDVLDEGRPQTLVAGANKPAQLMFDLDGDTPLRLFEIADAEALVKDHRFDAEVALHFGGHRRIAFYDTSDDGVFDLILVDDDEDDAADWELRLRDRWSIRNDIDSVWLSGDYLEDQNWPRS